MSVTPLHELTSELTSFLLDHSGLMAFFLGLMTLVSTLVVPGTWPHTRRCPSPRASESTPAEQAQKAESLKAALSAAERRPGRAGHA